MKKTLILFSTAVFAFMTGGAELKSPEAPFVNRAAETGGSPELKLSIAGVSFGDKLLSMPGDNYMCFLKRSKKLFSVECRAETVPRAWRPFRKFTKTLAPDRLTGRHEFVIAGNEKGTFTQTAEIVGKKVKISLSCDPGGSRAFVAPIWSICIPRTLIQGRTILLDARKFPIPSATEWGEGKKLWINMAAPFLRRITLEDFAIEFPEKTGVILFRNADELQIRFRHPKNQESFFLDPGWCGSSSDADTVAGINFRDNNDFSVAVYNPEGNLLMNPAFLSGMRYMRTPAKLDPESLLCRTESKFGGYSAKPGFTLFTVPIREDTPYTFSFYAKSLDRATHEVEVRGKSYVPFRTPPRRYRVGPSDWQRFEYTFRQSSTAVALSIDGSPGVVVDGLQLEEGERATPYQGSPFGLEIRTDSPHGQLVEYGSAFNARLLLRGPRGAGGKLNVEITDFFKRRIFAETFDFTIPENGEFVRKLLPDQAYPRGLNIIRVTVTPEQGRSYTDYLRLSVIKFADNAKKNKNLHAVANVAPWTSITQLPAKYLELLMKCAVGAVQYADRRAWLGLQDHLSPAAEQLYRKYRIDNLGHYLTDTILKKTNGANRRIPVIGTAELKSGEFYWNQLKPGGYPDAFFKMVEEQCYRLAKQHPEVTYWNTDSEPDGSEMLRQGHYEEYAKFMLACYRGVKRANPENRYRGAGACNMGEAGRRTVIKLLAAAQKLDPSIRFDVIDIHPYRPFPEMPDMETDFLLFKKQLREIGYGDVKINLGEGAYFYPLIVSQWLDISPWASTTGSKDPYQRLLLPSYDLGWGERVGAAMLLRYWLFAYKYRKDLVASTTWCPMLLDNAHPFAWMLMSSALNDILGNADFRRDVRFHPGARSYLFEDEEKRAVAAVWYFEEAMDLGMKNAQEMEFDPRALKGVEFIDMMGNQVSVRKGKRGCFLPLSNYPFFIRSAPGTLNQLAEALENSRVNSGDRPPVQFSLHFTSSDSARITATNLLSRQLEVDLTAGEKTEQKFHLPARGSRSFPIALSSPLSASHMTEFSIPLSVRSAGNQTSTLFKTAVLAVKHVEEPFDWETIPEIPIPHLQPAKPTKEGEAPALYQYGGEKDFSAKMQIAWNEKALFLRITVRDDQLICDPEILTRPQAAYASDGIQIFFDNFGDGKEKAARGGIGFDENDGSYEILPVDETRAIVFRRHAPDTQLTGGVHDCLLPYRVEGNVPCTFSYKDGIRVCDVVFPARYLMPMTLKAGATPGLGVAVFDRDSLKTGEKQTLLLNRIHPFQRPDAFTTLLLLPR